MTLSKTIHQVERNKYGETRALYSLLEELDVRLAGGEDYQQTHVESSAAKTDFTPVVFKAPVDGSIMEASFIPNGVVAKSDSDYLTFGLQNGTVPIVTAKTTKSTGGVAMAQSVEIPFTISEVDSVVDEDDVITMNIVNTGSSGKAFPGGLVVLKFTPD
jgi:hypothetical protein